MTERPTWTGRVWSFAQGNNFFPIVLIVAGFFVYQKCARPVPTSQPQEQGPAVVAQPAQGTEKVPVAEKPPPRTIRTYDKIRLAAQLKIPEIAFQPGEIIATAKIPPHAGNTTAWGGLDNTGTGYIGYSRDPPPKFQFKREGAFEVFYFPFSGRYAFTGDVVANPVNLYGLDLTAKAGISLKRDTQNVEWHVGLGASYKFNF